MAFLTWQGKPLKTPAAPAGVLSYEFAWSRAQAETILDSWKDKTETARRQLMVDFGFLLVYPLAIALGCAMLGESSQNQMAAVGLFLSWAVLAAAPLDAAENFLLLKMLPNHATQLGARMAAIFAGLKFALVFAGLGYVVLQGLAVLLSKFK